LTAASPAPEPTQRLFFALWPDGEARAALTAATARAVRRSGGRPVPEANLHVTLAFLGSVPTRRIPELQRIARERAAARIQETPLSLTFERLAHWSRAQILCALAAEAPPAVPALSALLKDTAAAAGFVPDLKPFQAHVTIARKVLHAPAEPIAHPVVWRFEDFALVDSRTEPGGPVYSVIESYSLVKRRKARK
jgi:RNA 2',3'-cyclic 3'-phosphodiesterase